MANFGSTLKLEIARIARRELRAETDNLKKSSTRSRTEIAGLKKQVVDLKRQVAGLGKLVKLATASPGVKAAAEDSAPSEGLRFRASGLASHRERLGLSGREAGQLLGVSALTINKWESGKARPRNSQMPAIAAFRKLGRREARSRLA